MVLCANIVVTVMICLLITWLLNLWEVGQRGIMLLLHVHDATLLKGKKYELTQISLLQVVITFGLIFLIPIYFIEYQIGFRINLELPFILILSYVVLFPGLASFLLWIKGISMIGANRSGVFLHLMPILSAIMAMIFFSEKFMFYHILGACFIITGILLSNKKVKNA